MYLAGGTTKKAGRHCPVWSASAPCALRRPASCRLGAALEHVQRIKAARCTIAGNEDRVSAALDRADNHQVVRQMEAFDGELRLVLAKLPAHAEFEVFRAV